MQQAILAERRSANQLPAASGNAFVINLVSSTTPVALTRPDHAGLNRFTFFVSRRREEGRERFRLHMGYFDSQEEAEKLLDIVRGIYPGAWAGLAPGRGLAAAAKGAASAAAGAQMREEPLAERLPAARAQPAGVRDAKTVAKVAPSSVPVPPRPAEAPALALVPDDGRRSMAQGPAEQPTDSERQTAVRSLSNIREAIASLDDSAASAPVLRAIPELKAAVIPTALPLQPNKPLRDPDAGAKSPRQAAGAELSDSAALRVLESGAKSATARASVLPSAAAIRPPTLHQAARSDAVERSRHEQPQTEKPCYAVQLMWSVQAIAMAQVPQLAIFSAYTLYGAEGNRDGRRWYGLRLGFFTDAVSAKQVAHYVRADFSTVSVVPVTVREREHAMLAASRATPATKPANAARKEQPKTVEFAFIEGTDPLTIKSAKPGGAAPVRTGINARATRGAPGKRAKQRTPGQIHARTRAKPITLEETLEILGAGQLQVDDEPGASINDSGVRHLRLEPAKDKPSKLTRLFERLSERLGS